VPERGVALLEALPPAKTLPEEENRAAWEHWQADLTVKPTLCDKLPPLRMLLVMDNLAGHLTAHFVVWLFEHGIMPLYTPLGGSWLNMTESIQRILAERALAGQTAANSTEIIEWLEATARAWNTDPTRREGSERHRVRSCGRLRTRPGGSDRRSRRGCARPGGRPAAA
jgi:hypothetical protein